MDYQTLKSALPFLSIHWTTYNVQSWLRFAGLEPYIDVFKKNKIDGQILRNLTESDLRQQLSIKNNIVVKKILAWVNSGLAQYDQYLKQGGYFYTVQECQIGQGNWGGDDFPSQSKTAIQIRSVETEIEKLYQFDKESIKIGRNYNCSICIESGEIQEEHALIYYEDQSYILKNLGDWLSLFIKVDKKIQIKEGMVLEMGRNHLEFSFRETTLVVEVVFGDEFGQSFEIPPENSNILIGRKQKCNICFKFDGTMSSLHGKLRFEDGRWTYEDMQTTNGTWIDVRDEAVLENKMQFKLGNTSFIYRVKLAEKPEKLAKYPPKQLTDMCYKCRVNEKNVVVSPCNHFCLCFECSQALEKCYLCESVITQKVKIYPS